MTAQPATNGSVTPAVVVAALAVGLVLLAMLAGLGSRWGWWHFRTGFRLLTWAAYVGIAVAIASAAVLYLSRAAGPFRGWPLALLALIVTLGLLAVPLYWRMRVASVPPIHDITTDTERPPEFVAVVPLREASDNPIRYGGSEIAAQQREAYPDIRPLVLDLPADRAFQRALDAAREMGWEIVAADPEARRIEATDRTFWFGFRDDLAIRLTPADGRTILDVRSASRVGRSDVGTNARRIRSYLEKVGTD